ncbi:MAG: carboxypeptidase-like regulatory domain-containing protein, partial [Burkholderiales bacterium]
MKTQKTTRSKKSMAAWPRCLSAVWCGAIALIAVTGAAAQSISGRITGTISDQAGAVIPNATVSVTNEGTGALRHATADGNGLYVVPELPVGFYAVKVEGGSFAPTTRTRVKVDVGAETRVDVTLTPQATELAVDVRAEAPLL